MFGVPSSSIIVSSSAPCSAARAPVSALAISPLTLATALPTPLPTHSSPPSRSSTASNSPVEAPEGTAATPRAPDSSATSTSTVGLPRESRIWRAWMEAIVLTRRPLYLAAAPKRRLPTSDLFFAGFAFGGGFRRCFFGGFHGRFLFGRGGFPAGRAFGGTFSRGRAFGFLRRDARRRALDQSFAFRFGDG